MRFFIHALTCIMFCLSSASAFAQMSETQAALLAKYRCPLSDLLRQVFEAPSAYAERDRFLVLSGSDRASDYVQCLFAQNRTKLYCEASTGYYDEAEDKPRRRYPSETAKAVFNRLGYSTGNDKKNYPYERDFTGIPDFGEIATLMLLTMHDAYGARAATSFKMIAPFAKRAPQGCASTS